MCNESAVRKIHCSYVTYSSLLAGSGGALETAKRTNVRYILCKQPIIFLLPVFMAQAWWCLVTAPKHVAENKNLLARCCVLAVFYRYWCLKCHYKFRYTAGSVINLWNVSSLLTAGQEVPAQITTRQDDRLLQSVRYFPVIVTDASKGEINVMVSQTTTEKTSYWNKRNVRTVTFH